METLVFWKEQKEVTPFIWYFVLKTELGIFWMKNIPALFYPEEMGPFSLLAKLRWKINTLTFGLITLMAASLNFNDDHRKHLSLTSRWVSLICLLGPRKLIQQRKYRQWTLYVHSYLMVLTPETHFYYFLSMLSEKIEY
jgi:hypothetical protein